MRLAQNDRTAGHTERLFRLLDAQVPEPGRPDFRGWEWWYLFSECHSERFSFPCQVRPIAWSPDEKYLATIERSGTAVNIGVNIWDVTSGKRKTSLRGCPGVIEAICWSPDGKYLAAGNDRGTIVIWEIASGKRVRALYGHAGAISSVDWNPDGVRLASGGADETIRIWDAHTAKTLLSLAVSSGPVATVDWHPDGKHLLATIGGMAKIWDTTSGQGNRRLRGWWASCRVQPGWDSRRLGRAQHRVMDLKHTRDCSIARADCSRSRSLERGREVAWRLQQITARS